VSTLRPNYYALLGLNPGATMEQIDKAFRYLIELYSDEALATYSLLEPGEARQLRAQLREAYELLRDPVRRLDYDVRHGLIAGAARTVSVAPDGGGGGAGGANADTEDRNARGARLAPTALPDPVTGSVLRAFREERGITLREIADATKITLRYLEYIEADRHGSLPAPVYLRGFLQEYARAVGLDPRRTSEQYLAGCGKHEGSE